MRQVKDVIVELTEKVLKIDKNNTLLEKGQHLEGTWRIAGLKSTISKGKFWLV